MFATVGIKRLRVLRMSCKTDLVLDHRGVTGAPQNSSMLARLLDLEENNLFVDKILPSVLHIIKNLSD